MTRQAMRPTTDAGRPAAHARLATAIGERARAAARGLLDLIYPPQCPGCGRLGEVFCPQCRCLVRPYPFVGCPRCGRPAPIRSLCPACAASPSPLDAILPATVFAHPIRQAIHQFKYEGTLDLAAPLSGWLAETWRVRGLDADLIVPVPLHPKRERERGYNQAVLLARGLSAAVGVPLAPAELVRTVRTLSAGGADARTAPGQYRRRVPLRRKRY